MAGEWRVATFEKAPLQIIDGDRGKNYPSQAEFSPAGHCLFLNAGNVTTNGFRFSDCAFITAAKDALLRKGKLVRNDVVLTTRGTVGNAAHFEDSVPFNHIRINSGMVILRAQVPALLPQYLYLFVRSALFHDQVSALRTGSAQPQLPIQDINRIEIPIPPPDEQRAIAHILGTLDDKIELNRRMNETLEAMARALFKSWFVDFDPVRAKHALSKVEGAESRDPGLPQPLANLFPDSFEDSELGEIPKGWAIGRFGDVVDKLRDQENPLASPDALFHHFSIPAFDEGQSPKPEYGESIKSLKSRVLAGVILLSKLNPDIERVWIVDVRPGERAVCSTEFLVLRALSPFTRSYVYCLARSPLFRQQIEGLVTGTSKSHQRAQVNSILNLAVVVPPSSIVVAFDHCADDLLARTLECRRESHALAALRDTLLPKLISGELRVGDSGRFSKVT